MIEKRRSKIQGWGVFATQPITKNTRIIDYTGEKITNRESLKREMRYLKKGHIWCFKLNRLYVRDAAVGGNISRFINHACKPNCYTQIIGADDLGPRRPQHREGRRADLRLFDRRREDRSSAAAVPAARPGSERVRLIYLHGFASSAQSSKAAFFRQKAARARHRPRHAGLQPAGLRQR